MKNLIPHFIQEKWLAGTLQGRFEAWTLFVDMSGFTRLTETLLTRGKEGAERLSDILNAIFGPMVHSVYQQGGFIPYFAGDAFIGLFPKDTCACNADELLRLGHHLLRLLEQASDQFPEFEIGIKVGLSAGDVEWGIVGDDHLQFYFKGEGIDGCVKSQMLAGNGQLVADSHYVPAEGGGSRFRRVADGFFSYEASEVDVFVPRFPEPHLPPLRKEVLARFLPEGVLHFNQRGEFRTVVSVFINFERADTHQALDEFARVVLEETYSYSGYFKEIDFSDKGGVMVVIFGAPVAFENNVERALEFVLALQEKLLPMQATSPLRYKVGMASGIAYAGIVGGKERCQYAAVGHKVNIAARAMMHAEWGEVLVDSEVQKSRQFLFRFKGNLHYKGLRQRVPTYQLLGRSPEQRPRFEGSLVGRRKELESLECFARECLSQGRMGLAVVTGEAGVGKTRFLFELEKRLSLEVDIRWVVCPSDQILRKQFNPFIFFLRRFFGQTSAQSAAINEAQFGEIFTQFVEALRNTPSEEAAEAANELLRTRPVLAALCGLATEDTFWDSLDARSRFQNIRAALVNFFRAMSLLYPVVIEFEDAQWMDDSSRIVVNDLVRHCAERPMFVIISTRYDEQGHTIKILDEQLLDDLGIETLEIQLEPLSHKDVSELLEERLDGSVNPKLTKLLYKTCNGNPFYIEQLLEFLIENGLLEPSDDGWTVQGENLGISSNVQTVLTARVDQLPQPVKETLKTAAVIGREFELPVLAEVMRKHPLFRQLNGQVEKAVREQVKAAERARILQAISERRYQFRHGLLHEAIYEMQLKSKLRKLHRRIGEAIEKTYAPKLADRYVDLVFHFENARHLPKLRLYLEKAADHAANYFQNRQALLFYDKLIRLLEKQGDKEALVKTMLKKARVLELIGRWEDCECLCQQTLELARELGQDALTGMAYYHLGHLLMLRGQYDAANSHLQYAAVFFDAVNDKLGMAQVFGDLGNLYFRQGKYQDAKLYFIRSIQLLQQADPTRVAPHTVANLGLTYMNLGKYDEGIRWLSSYLEKYQQLGDRQGMAILHVNLGIIFSEKGDYDQAAVHLQKGLALSQELGNKQLTAIAIGHLGTVYMRRGDFDLAMEYYLSDLRICEELGDQQGISIATGLIGELYSLRGEWEKALEYLERHLDLSTKLNYRKGIAKALNSIGDVYYYKGDFERSLKYYDRALEVTRQIGNKLVEGFSLVEKAMVLIAMGYHESARHHLEEARTITDKLQHPELSQALELCEAHLLVEDGRHEEARTMLQRLLEQNPNEESRATILYLLAKIDPEGPWRQQAMELYQSLYRKAPVYLYKLRLEELTLA